MTEKNLGLSERHFHKLVEGLKNGDETLFELAFKELVPKSIDRLQYKYRINRFDAKDAVINALYNFRNLILKDKIRYSNISFLFNQMSYQEYIRLKKGKIKFTELNDYNTHNYHSEIDSSAVLKEEQYKILDLAMSKVDKKCVELIKIISQEKSKLYEIAEKLDLSHDVIRKRKQRCIEKLKSIIGRMNLD